MPLGSSKSRAWSIAASTYRPSYARRPRDFPRQNVFCGTTNEEEYFTDRRNRRYWPVRVTRANVQTIARDRDQLWAEAFWRYEQGEKWWPDAELERLCAQEQADRVLPDDWQGPRSAKATAPVSGPQS